MAEEVGKVTDEEREGLIEVLEKIASGNYPPRVVDALAAKDLLAALCAVADLAALHAAPAVPASPVPGAELEVKRFQEAAMRGLHALEQHIGHQAAYELIFQPRQGAASAERGTP